MDDVPDPGAIAATDEDATEATATATAHEAMIRTARDRTGSSVTAYASTACASGCCIRGRWAPRSGHSSLPVATTSRGHPTGGAPRHATVRVRSPIWSRCPRRWRAAISCCRSARRTAAQAVAQQAVEAGLSGVFVDANAVSPATARAVGDIVTRSGARFVDGGIVGGPPTRHGTTRLFLAGSDAPMVAELFDGTALETVVLDGAAGAASALKACYAANTKGTTALLLAIRALARAEGVDEALLEEWARSQPELVARSENGPRGSARKAWRFAGEMDEIADALAAAGVPDGFHRGAAELYRRLDRFKDAPEPPSLADLVDAVRRHQHP